MDTKNTQNTSLEILLIVAELSIPLIQGKAVSSIAPPGMAARTAGWKLPIGNGTSADRLSTGLPAGLSEWSSQRSPPRMETHLVLRQVPHEQKELTFEVRVP